MNCEPQVWGIVLAAGEGARLGSLTRDDRGVVVPKQYCSFAGGPSLLSRGVARASALAGRERVLVVVAAQHREWWEAQLSDLPADNVIEQPCNRGTACGLLLPLAILRQRCPSATVVVLPSDHYLADEATFLAALREGVHRVGELEGRLLLLGINPDSADPEYGWIRPDGALGSVPSRVMSFVEKPDQALAERLMASGALWNSFTFVVTADTLWALFLRWLPGLAEHMEAALARVGGDWRAARLDDVYRPLPTLDFERAILERADEELRVLPVPPCGWTDLGTPERIAACLGRVLSRRGERQAHEDGTSWGRAPLDLAHALVYRRTASSPR